MIMVILTLTSVEMYGFHCVLFTHILIHLIRCLLEFVVSVLIIQNIPLAKAVEMVLAGQREGQEPLGAVLLD